MNDHPPQVYGENANPDALNVRFETPLMFAAGNGHLDIVSWLVDVEGWRDALI